MTIEIRAYSPEDLGAVLPIWNEVVLDGVAFPQMETLDATSGAEFFARQDYVGVAVEAETRRVVGLYILHPNNIGRCGHLCNTSYAVASAARGRGVGEKLVADSLRVGKALGFRVMQFNAVVASNAPAIKLYEKLGFTRLGTIPGGFRVLSGEYEDIILYYKEL